LDLKNKLDKYTAVPRQSKALTSCT